MQWDHILVACDDSPAGLHAARIAERIAHAAEARLSVLTVLESTAEAASEPVARLKPIVAYGVPGIEIVRVTDEIGADLVVLGRTVSEDSPEPRLGSTADAVARRSRVPCLFVPHGQDRLEHLVVALDGTERGLAVLTGAREFMARWGGDLEVVTVELGADAGTLDTAVPSSHHLRIARALGGPDRGEVPAVRILRGEPTTGIRENLAHPDRDLLVIGARRGGPVGLPQGSTGVGRRLLHFAPCAVLTIPL